MDGWKTRNSAGKFDFGTVSRDLATSVAKEFIFGVEKDNDPLIFTKEPLSIRHFY